MRWLRRFRELDRRERRTLLGAWWLLLLVDIGLRTMPYRRVEAVVRRWGRRRRAADESRPTWERLERLHWLVAVAAGRHAHPVTCLRRSLVLRALLARRGVAAELRFGVHRDTPDLQAHAWLEVDGRPLGERPETLARLVPLERYPG